MGHGKATFKQADLTRALRAVEKAGRDVVRAPAEATAPARAPANAASSRPHTAPWHGPIVAVV